MSSRFCREIFASPSGRSRPLEIDPWDLKSDLEKIEQQWDPLRKILLSEPASATRKAEISAWSTGQQAGHAVLVAEIVATRIRKLLESPGIDAEKRPAPFMRDIFQKGEFPRGRARAPKHVLPFDRTRDDFLALLEGTQRNWWRLAERSAELKAGDSRYPHIVFGYLNAAEWTRFCAIHTAHHLKIASEILDACRV